MNGHLIANLQEVKELRAQGWTLKRIGGHVVHHVDGDHRNNTLMNLWVFASQREHMSFHRGGLGWEKRRANNSARHA